MASFDDLNLPGSTVTGHFAFVTADGPDEDDFPDVMLASGTVRFEPTAKAVRAGGAWVGISPVTAQIFDGELVVSEEDPRPVRILSTDADTGVEGWGWSASFDIEGASIKPIRFRAPAEGVHLTGDDLIPITGQPVEVIAAGALGRLTEVESTVTAHGTRITDIEDLVVDHESRLDQIVDDADQLATKVDGLTGKVVAPLGAGASAGTVQLTQSGGVVVATGTGLVLTGTSEVIATIPAGWGPPHKAGHGYVEDTINGWWPTRATATQIQVMGPAPAGTTVEGSITWSL